MSKTRNSARDAFLNTNRDRAFVKKDEKLESIVSEKIMRALSVDSEVIAEYAKARALTLDKLEEAGVELPLQLIIDASLKQEITEFLHKPEKTMAHLAYAALEENSGISTALVGLVFKSTGNTPMLLHNGPYNDPPEGHKRMQYTYGGITLTIETLDAFLVPITLDDALS